MVTLYELFTSQDNDIEMINIKVSGNSMLPIFHDGDVVTLKKVKRDLCIGDIILRKSKGTLLLHRIVFINHHFIVTKGDNNPYADQPCILADVIGIVDYNESAISLQTGANTPTYRPHLNKIINIWGECSENDVRDLKEVTDIEVINYPNKIFEDGKNVAIFPQSPWELIYHNIDFDQRVYFHVGVPISNFKCDGFIIDSKFDHIFRLGTYATNNLLTSKEFLLFLLGHIKML